MKILIVRNSPTEVNIHNYNVQEIGLAKALTKKKHEVGIVFYTNGQYKEEIQNKIKIYYVPGKKILNYNIYNKKVYEIAKQYDIIQSSEYNQIMSYNFCKKMNKKTVIYHGPYYRNKFITKVNNFVFDLLFLRKYRKLNPTFITKSYLAEDFLIKKKFNNVITLGVGLDASKFSDKSKIEVGYKIDKNNYNLLVIGTIEKRKNTKFLLKLLNKLVSTSSKYHMLFIGKCIEEKYYQKCKHYIIENHLEENVTFLPPVSQENLKYYFENSNLFLLASTYEIFGMVLLEAAYFHLPILASLNGGSSYLLDKGSIVEDFDIETWYNKIVTMKKEKINKTVLWDDIVSNFEKVYKSKK